MHPDDGGKWLALLREAEALLRKAPVASFSMYPKDSDHRSFGVRCRDLGIRIATALPRSTEPVARKKAKRKPRPPTPAMVELARAMEGGARVIFIHGRGDPHYFRSDTMQRCTVAAEGLIDRGLAEKVNRNKPGFGNSDVALTGEWRKQKGGRDE